MAANNERQTQESATRVDSTLARHGGLSYLEIPAVDARQSAAFYANVLGWNLHGADTDDPRFDDATGHLIGRWRTGLAVAREPGLLPFIYVDDIDAAVARARAYGGEVVKAIYPRETCGLLPFVTRRAT